MSADWYYLGHGWLHRTKRIGPLDESTLLKRIDHGDIQPETLLQSETKTRGRWIKMAQIPAAVKRWRKLHPTS